MRMLVDIISSCMSKKNWWKYANAALLVTVRKTDLPDVRVVFFLSQVFDIVELEAEISQAIGYCRSGSESALRSRVVFQVKNPSRGRFNLSSPDSSLNPKNDCLHTLLSRHLRHCCVGFTSSPKARWVTSIKMRILDIFILVTTDAWSDQVVSSHNQARAQYGAAPVTWNSELYSSTLSYAQGCKFAHRYKHFFSCMATELNDYHISDPQGQYGENLVGYFVLSKIWNWLTPKYLVCRDW
jgi:hypothetical protein